MKIDPDNYDLRELRRIADERRADRRDDDATSRDDEERPARRGREQASDRPRDTPNRRERGRDSSRRDDDSRTPPRRERDRSGRDGRLRRPRGDGRSVRDDARDDVLRADRLARELGLGRPDRRDERHSNGDRSPSRDSSYDELGYAYDDRREQSDSERRRRPETGRDRSPGRPDDVGEFRFDHELRERPRGRAGEVLRDNQLEQLLIHETAAAGDALQKPYLTDVPAEYAAERVVFDWLEFLVLKGGFKRTMDVLRYYLTVDWITEPVEEELHDYLVGFSGNVGDTEEFDVDDHHLSLLYVARLASMG
jgi:archaellum component FlaD/FlaE